MPDVPHPRRRKEDRDSLARFQRPLVFFRWLVVALSGIATVLTGHITANRTTLLALVIWTAIRTLEPIRVVRSRFRTIVPLFLEMGAATVLVSFTGGWASPNTLILLPPLIVIAALVGTTTGITMGLIAGVFVTGSMSIDGVMQSEDALSGVRWTGTLMLVGLLVGAGFRIITDVAKAQQLTTARMAQLQEANTLLYDLQRIARRLPSSLDLGEVLRTTVAEFAASTGLSRVTVLLLDEGEAFSVAGTIGCSMPMSLLAADLPAAARAAINARVPIAAHDGDIALLCGGVPARVQTGIYAPLVSREQLIGLLVAEALPEDRYVPTGTTSLDDLSRQFVGPAALAIDNARWFGRIRSVAADDERVRIARDMHDRIGQSLALLGFEVDRVTRLAQTDEMRRELGGLRDQVRSATQEVRETLYDLRTDVTDAEDLDEVLGNFLERVESRSGIATELDASNHGQLPLRVSRELWLIAQEAIRNAERHSRCESIFVRWWTDGVTAELDVADNGQGFVGSGRTDSYGLRGLRERAAGIGAHVDVRSAPNAGTTIRVRLVDS